MSAYDTAFPGVDSSTINALRTAGSVPSANISTIRTGIDTTERNNFLTLLNATEGTSNNTLSSSILLSRNRSIDNIAKDMTYYNKKLMNGSKDTYLRQGEINEWQAQNKLDTLFFLQTTFLFFTLIVFLIFLRQYGVVTNGMLWMIVSFFTLILVGILWNRASYTNYSRDKRYWNRRYIGLTDSSVSAAAASCPQ